MYKIQLQSIDKSYCLNLISPVADPGFPVGGVDLVGGAWALDALTFCKFCMSKRKNLDPWGACAGHAPPKSANEA